MKVTILALCANEIIKRGWFQNYLKMRWDRVQEPDLRIALDYMVSSKCQRRSVERIQPRSAKAMRPGLQLWAKFIKIQTHNVN